MWPSEIIIAVILIYIAVCAFVGTIGIDRQIGFWLTFVITIFTTPIVGLIVAALSSKKTVNVSVKNSEVEPIDITDKLLKLNDLKEKGILTEEEFLQQKEKILNQ